MSQFPEPLLKAEASNPATSGERLIELSASAPLRRIVAGNPAAPMSLLEILSQDQDVQVRESVATNPSTPWQTLESLAWEFPQAFLANALGPLYLLVQPEQIRSDETF